MVTPYFVRENKNLFIGKREPYFTNAFCKRGSYSKQNLKTRKTGKFLMVTQRL